MAWQQSASQRIQALALARLQALHIECLAQIDSTNSELLRRAQAGCNEPTILLAHTQTAGRGRMGRQWHSHSAQAGQGSASLTFSISLPLAPKQWLGLSLAVGLAVREALPVPVQLKWPNDIWLQGRKLAGILIETCALPPAAALPDGEPARWVVIGLGLNLLAPPTADADLRHPAAALAQALPPDDPLLAEQPPHTLLTQLAYHIIKNCLRFEVAGFTPFRADFIACDALHGQAVTLDDGRHGFACGVNDEGALLLRLADGSLLPIIQAEASLRPAQASSTLAS